MNLGFLSDYAFVLKPKGRIYCITDVEELHNWHVEHLEKHSMFRKLEKEEQEADPFFHEIWNKTEEGQKVERNKGSKWACVYERI